MPRAESWLLAFFILLAVVAGGIFSTAAWLYESQGSGAEPVVALVNAPGGPVGTPAATVSNAPILARTPTASVSAPSLISTPAPTSNAASPKATPAPAGNVSAGKQIYQSSCAGCHPNGDKGVGPSLRSPEFKTKFADDAALKKIITAGTSKMPGFSQLNDSQLNDLVAYIRSLP